MLLMSLDEAYGCLKITCSWTDIGLDEQLWDKANQVKY